MTFRLTCVYIIFGSVSVAEWPPLGKRLLTRLTLCSLGLFFNITHVFMSRFGFEGWDLNSDFFSS